MIHREIGSEVCGFPPGTAATWTRLGDFINGDGKLSVSEQGLFFSHSLSPLKSTTLKVLLKVNRRRVG